MMNFLLWLIATILGGFLGLAMIALSYPSEIQISLPMWISGFILGGIASNLVMLDESKRQTK